MKEKLNSDDKITVSVERGGSMSENVDLTGVYTAACYRDPHDVRPGVAVAWNKSQVKA